MKEFVIVRYAISIKNKRFLSLKRDAKTMIRFLNKVFKILEQRDDWGIKVNKMYVSPEIKKILKDVLGGDFWCYNHLWTADVKSVKDIPVMVFSGEVGEVEF